MTYSMQDLIADCQAAIDPATGTKDLEAIRQAAERIAANPDFVAEYFGPEAEAGTRLIYRDPELDFMVLAHIKDQGTKSPPHDHGASWAVYCQVVKHVDMTEYDRLDDGSEAGRAELKVRRDYRLEPGHAGFFDAFQIHSIHVPDGARFLRITGTDLTKLETSRYDMAKGSVTVIEPNDRGDVSGGASA